MLLVLSAEASMLLGMLLLAVHDAVPATSAGHLEVVELLLSAGADVHIKNSKAWAAVHSAAAGGHFEVVLRLIHHGSVWRGRADVDVIKLLMRKTSLKCVCQSAMLACFEPLLLACLARAQAPLRSGSACSNSFIALIDWNKAYW